MTLSCVKVPDLSCRFGMMLRYGPKRVIFSGLHSTNQSQVSKERNVNHHGLKESNLPCIFHPVNYKSAYLKQGLNSRVLAACQNVNYPNIDIFQQADQARIQSLLKNKIQRDSHISMLNLWSKTPFIDNQQLALLSLQHDKALHQWERLLVPEKRVDVYKKQNVSKQLTIEDQNTLQTFFKEDDKLQHTDMKNNSSIFHGCSRDVLSSDKRLPLSKEGVCLFKGTDKRPTPPSPDKGKPPPQRGASPLQLSEILLKLREELPWFFYGGHKFDIYHKNVGFVNGLVTNRQTRGLWLYRLQMRLMRWAAVIGYQQVTLNILHITKHDKESAIKIRWQVQGLPRYRIFSQYLTFKVSEDQQSYIDAISTLEVNSDGKVVFHSIEKLMRGEDKQLNPKFTVNAAAVIAAVQGMQSASVLPGILETSVQSLDSKLAADKSIPVLTFDITSLIAD